MTTPTIDKAAQALLIDDDGNDAIGKVTASPEANTILGRLKAIESGAGTSGAITIANGADVAEGSTTDDAASSTVAESTTARTSIGLLKGVKNILILLNAKFAALGQKAKAGSVPVTLASDEDDLGVTSTQLPAALAANGGLKVEGVAGGVAVPISGAITGTVTANAAIANGSDVAQGTTTDDAASSTVAESTTARTGIGLWKGIKNILILVNAKLPSTLAASGGLPIEGVAGGVAVPISGSVTASGTVTVGAVTPPTTLFHGRKTITTAGTEEAIASSQALAAGIVYVKALYGNTGYVYVGKTGVSSADGYVLLAGEEVVICTDNLIDVFVDVSVNGEGVTYLGS